MLAASSFKVSPPNMLNRVMYPDGYNENIITTLNDSFPAAVEHCKNSHFSGGTATEKARAIYNYLRRAVRYEKDPEGRQMIQLPGRLINDRKKGDCKSLSLAAAAFMHCAGIPNVRLRYAGYKAGSTTPTHVYAVGSDENGRDIIVDAVFHQFNREVPYKSKKDYKMQISVLSGPATPAPRRMLPVKLPAITYAQRLQKLRERVRPGGILHNVISNELARVNGGPFTALRYSSEQIQRYTAMIQRRAAAAKKPFLKSVLEKEAQALTNGKFAGVIYTPRSGGDIAGIEEEIGRLSLKKIGRGLKKISPKNLAKGVKAVGLVAPRKAFLILVRLNVRGLATRLSKAPADKLRKLWADRLAGKWSVLQATIKAGAKKKPLFGAGRRVKAVNGIGVVPDDSTETIGEATATAAVITAAAPVLIMFMRLLKNSGIPPVSENAATPGESGEFTDAEGAAAEARPGLSTFLEKAQDIAKQTGIIPDKPATPEETAVNNLAPGDDLTGDPSDATRGRGGSSFELSPLMIAGGLGLIYVATKK